MTSAIRAYQNRINAQKSTGPKTAEGKDRVRMNATTHGLTGQRFVMQEHELAEYRRMSSALYHELKPASEQERQMVQKIVDAHMRLNRITAIENNMLGFALVENLRADTSHDDDTEAMMAQSRAWMDNEASFDRLSRYRARATNELLKCSQELERLQDRRRARARDIAAGLQLAEKESENFRLASFCKPPFDRVMTASSDAAEPPVSTDLTPVLPLNSQSEAA